MLNFLITLGGISLAMSVVIILMLALRKPIKKRFAALGRYIIWSVIIIRLCLPVSLDILPKLITLPSVMPEEEAVIYEPVTPEVMPDVPAEPVTPEIPAAPEAPAAGAADLNAFYLSLVDTYGENFPANMNLCDMVEMLDGFYPGLSGLDTKQMMIYQPMMGAVVCEIALVEVANEGDVETVKGIFQKRIDDQVAGGAWYPESIEGWKNNSRVVANGNCVMMIAYSECEAVVESFNAIF